MTKEETKLLFEISYKMYNAYAESKARYDNDWTTGYCEAVLDCHRLIIAKLCDEELEI